MSVNPDAIRPRDIRAELESRGAALVPGLLPPGLCDAAAAMFERQEGFRSTVVMERHGFGRGSYKYFSYPLPPLVAALREQIYPVLAPIANDWRRALGRDGAYPPTLETFLQLCHDRGQTRPTPLLLRYGPGDYNCLHQDLYGETVFPLQLAILLTDPDRFEGGEFIMTEQRPRRQSRAEVIPLAKGDAAIFAVNERPVAGSRGTYRVRHRHGVSTVRAGTRLTLGIIFHDAAPAGTLP
jgi:uncharacterized protein